jgi:hypothetical protein
MSRNSACFPPGSTRKIFGTKERSDASGGGQGNWGIVAVSGGGEAFVGDGGAGFVAGAGAAVVSGGGEAFVAGAGAAAVSGGGEAVVGGRDGAGCDLITVGAHPVSSNSAMRQIAQ